MTNQVATQPVQLHALRDLIPDPGSPFHKFVLTYLVASAGLTPVYDAARYKDFMVGLSGLFPSKSQPAARVNLEDWVGLARGGALPQEQAEISLCCMLANAAYESIPKKVRALHEGNPVFEFFRHARNAGSHGNAWSFKKKETLVHAEWNQIVLTKALQGQPCFYGTLQPADLLYLLRDVEALLK